MEEIVSLLSAYAITFGWALVGAMSMAVALGLSLWVFSKMTPVDEWKLIGEGSVPMGMILAALIIATGLVVASVVRP